MNNFMNNFGNFQRDVGVASAAVSMTTSYILGGLFIFIGLICIWLGFMVTDTSSNFTCKIDDDCKLFEEKCNQNKKCFKPAQRHYIAGTIAGLIFILLAIGIIVFSKKSYELSKTNRGFAQLEAIAPEISLLDSIFKAK